MSREISLINLLYFLFAFAAHPQHQHQPTALCNEDANGNVPLGKSCNRYWSCQGGYPRLQRCPAMLVFDKHSLRCVVPPTDECDIPTTPTPIEEQPAPERGQVKLLNSIHIDKASLTNSFQNQQQQQQQHQPQQQQQQFQQQQQQQQQRTNVGRPRN